MNRRTFFKSVSTLLSVASLSPQIFIPKFEPVHFKVISRIVPNPAYINAAYELVAREMSGYWSYDLRKTPVRVDLSDPRKKIFKLRYDLIDPVTYEPVSIPPFIKS